MAEKEADFSGWATKHDLKCSDGRTIMRGAFKHMDKKTVPLVWMHQHSDPENVLGHAVLEDRAFGIYAYAFFNETPAARHIKESVQHGDITSMSIFANNLTEKNREVYHGDIKEVSLVLAGANPGALIENISFAHGDDFRTLEKEAIIYSGDEEGLSLSHHDESEGVTVTNQKNEDATDETTVQHAEATAEVELDEASIASVLQNFDEKEMAVVTYLMAQVAGNDSDDEQTDNESDDEETDGSAEHSDVENNEDSLAHNQSTEGNTEMTRNVFEQNGEVSSTATLTHDQFATIVNDAQKSGSLKETLLAHADAYGITDINMLFPDAKAINNTPDLVARRMEWVAKVLGETRHSPFAKVKSLFADITADEARAKGYIKGTMKKEEVIKLLKRTTSPTTVYKKQKLDRDDVLDITDFDVVAWLKAEIRLMLEEEIARAILVGDGRSAGDPDKIKDPEGAVDGTGIRSILHDNEFYAHRVELSTNVAPKDAVKGLVRARSHYRGTGKPTLFVSDTFLTDIMLEEDKFGRPLYETEQSLADKLRVKEIVTVDLFDDSENLFAIMVNLADYTIGANKGGELTSFEDFDIDFNQQKYLMETRISGALTKYKSAIVVTRQQGTAVTPAAPTFANNTITVPTTAGVTYLVNDAPVTGDVVITEDTEVVASANSGYYIPAGTTKSWSFTYTAE